MPLHESAAAMLTEKKQKTKLKEAFLSLSEEEMFKYFEIFKKTLSGTVGKNLINMDFPLEQEKEGGTQEFLLRLRGSKLQDDSVLKSFMIRSSRLMITVRIIISS